MDERYVNVHHVQKSALKSEWEEDNPILLLGEIGFESDTGNFKFGNGIDVWSSLNYIGRGLFTTYVDDNGDLYFVSEADMDNPFEYDEDTGELFYLFDEDKKSLIGNVKGNPGPNQVTTATATNITGLLRGNGATIEAAEEADPTVPLWAKQPDRPTYTAADVGAAPATHAAQHHTGGADAIAPGDIGAADETHAAQHATGGSDAITPASIGAAYPARAVSATLTAAGWSNGLQTVSVAGMTVDSIIVVSPQPASLDAYAAAGVRCTAKGSGMLTFAATTTPTETLTADILIVG